MKYVYDEKKTSSWAVNKWLRSLAYFGGLNIINSMIQPHLTIPRDINFSLIWWKCHIKMQPQHVILLYSQLSSKWKWSYNEVLYNGIHNLMTR